ncbi:MAG: tRNA guanosine(34) transglycosylase Tgt [bacterium]|nr:tRNA guanosine(34) transglycosylase Tgt [bacterium]
MKFSLTKKINNARIGKITTHHGDIDTPVFMPVGTMGSVRAMKGTELVGVGAQIILGNTYHLYLRPGVDILERFGGLHNFMGWHGPILTDSGGYQVFSLGKRSDSFQSAEEGEGSIDSFQGNLVRITDEGAVFKSHIDGSKHLFTPEKVIDIQLAIGSDIMMPLDHCPSADADDKEIEAAVDLTSKWFERTWKYFDKKTKEMEKKPALFAIIQGGANEKLRKRSFEFLSQFLVDGFSIGGVANAGESKLKQQKALEFTLPLIPEDKPRYLMGVGEPADIINAINQGVDMFDCVLPTRLARHGVAWVSSSSSDRLLESVTLPDAVAQERCTTLDSPQSNLTNLWLGKKFGKVDFRKSSLREGSGPIMEGCDCFACRVHSRAYIHHLVKSKEILGIRLLTEHNLRFVLRLFEDIRRSVAWDNKEVLAVDDRSM